MADMTDADAIQGWLNIPPEFAAEFGDEGDPSRRYLLNPVLFRMLGDVTGKVVLDAGCGQGYLSRLLARRGARVTAVDPATPLISYAVERERAEALGIRYVQAGLNELPDLGQTLDVVVANMVLMDIPDYLGALDVCFHYLRPGGQLVCSLAHPCFEESDAEYRAKGYGAVGEYFPLYVIPQRWGPRFHRPLSHYLNALIARGGLIRSVVEPQLDPVHAQQPPTQERNLHVPAFIVIDVLKATPSP